MSSMKIKDQIVLEALQQMGLGRTSEITKAVGFPAASSVTRLYARGIIKKHHRTADRAWVWSI